MTIALVQGEPAGLQEMAELAATMVQAGDGTIRCWSAGCERLYGFPAAEAIGRHSQELLQTEYAVPPDEIAATLRRDGDWTGELCHRRRDGTRIWVLAHRVLRVSAADGQSLVMENSVDATLQHLALASGPQAQAQAKAAVAQLKAQVAALEQQLAQTQKMAAIGQLTSSVAHDFNNFLTVVMVNAEHLHSAAEAAGNGRDAHRAAMIEQAAERGARLAFQLLAFARNQSVSLQTTAMEPLLGAMQDLLRGAAGSANKLQIRCAPDVWPIRIDPTQLESALLNLVINARDAAPAGGGRIAITMENVPLNLATAARLRLPPGEFVRISVADNGIGMAPEVLERVLEPFFTTKAAGKGTGLGLAQVHGFVGQSGGAIDIQSAPGQGTTVSLLLPRAPVALAGSPDDASAEAAASQRCVLVVEEQPELRETARTMLEEHGYRVMAVQDALAARAILAGSEPVNVLFADLVLPGGATGMELARDARRLRPDIGVLLTSGYAEAMPGQRGPAVRDVEILLQPYATSKLSARMRRFAAGVVPPPLMWSSAHEVGIQEIDEQHARLGRLLNELAAVLKDGGDHTAALTRVVRYAEFHFAAEERLMAAHDYHDAIAHGLTHRRLLAEIHAFQPGVDGVSVSLALDYLQDWLLRHVDSQDRELAATLRACGVP